MDDDLRVSDNDRINALRSLSAHYTEGRLDHGEFDERTGAVTRARTVGELRVLFTDLPGGVAEALHPPAGGGVDKRDVDELELEKVRRSGRRIDKLDAIIGGVTFVAFLVLLFLFSWSWAWIVWPVMGITLGISRAVQGFSDSDEKAYKELKEAEEKARRGRLRRATERMRELE